MICIQLYGSKQLTITILGKWSNSSIWPIDVTLTDATNPDQSETGSNGNEEVLNILQSSNLWLRRMSIYI